MTHRPEPDASVLRSRLLRTSRRVAVLLALGALAPAIRAQCEIVELVPPQADDQDDFAEVNAIDGDWIVAGAPGDDGLAPDAGAAYFFERTAGGWAQSARHTPPGGGAFDAFGTAVAIQGDWAFVGAPGHAGAGVVFAYARTGSSWAPVQTIVPSSAVSGAAFGTGVAVSGSTLLVGAPLDRPAPTDPDPQGRVFVFELQAGAWVETQVVDFGAELGEFGEEVAVRGDVAGVFNATTDEYWVLERSGATWSVLHELFSSLCCNPVSTGRVAVGDGFLVTGQEYDGAGQWYSRPVVYTKHPTAPLWLSTPDVLIPPSLSFSDFDVDGTRIVVTDVGDSDAAPLAGAASVLEYDNGQWTLLAKLLPDAPGSDELMGYSPGIDGDTVVVGALGGPIHPHAGSVRAFSLSGTGQGALTACPGTLSLAAGGSQNFALDAGAGQAGGGYLLLGTTAGTSPGLDLIQSVLPLNVSDYLLFTIASPNTHIAGSFGLLDAEGRASATSLFPPNLNPILATLEFHYAFVVLNGGFPFTSNAASLVFAP